VREIRQHGSEGGGAERSGLPTPIVARPAATTASPSPRAKLPASVWARDGHCLSAVIPGKSSVRNGVRGSPAPEYMLQIGLSAQA